MIATTEFLPRILPHVSGCSQPMALQALVDSAIAFCEDSMVVRQRLDTARTSYGRVDFDVDAPAQQAVSRILKVWIDGIEAPAIAANEVGEGLSPLARPKSFYTLMDGGALTANLYPVPDGVYRLACEVALRPTRNATAFSNELFNIWMEPVVTGALARLMSTPDQPFTNLALGQAATAKALYLSRRARVEGSYGRGNTTVKVRQRPFA